MTRDLDLSRRGFLKRSVVGAGALTAGFAGGLTLPQTAHAALGYLPADSSHLLDVNMVKKYAWYHYHANGGCMNGAASGLIDGFKDAYSGEGTDWDQIPSGATSWFKFGSGGISCWGTLCGILNGCISALGFANLWSPLATEVLGHSCETEFPPRGLHDLFEDPTYGWDTGYAPEPVPDHEVLAYTTAYSPLCHVSISKWCYAAGVDLNDMSAYANTHKNDRCGKACAYMAGHTAELINYYLVNAGVENPYQLPDATASCKTCHFKVSDPFTAQEHPAQCGLMDCAECHSVDAIHQGLRLIVEDVWTTDGTGTVKNTFTSGDPIQYHVRFHVLGGGSCYVKAVKSKAKDGAGVKMLALTKDETLTAATYDWVWSDTIGVGDATGTAKVIVSLKMLNYAGGELLGEETMKHKFTIE